MKWEQFLKITLGTSGLPAIIVAIINKCPNFKPKKKKSTSYRKVVKGFKKLLKKYNLVNVSELMIFIVLDAAQNEYLNAYQCTDEESRAITNMLLDENYLYVAYDKTYKWNKKQEELSILLDYYFRITNKIND